MITQRLFPLNLFMHKHDANDHGEFHDGRQRGTQRNLVVQGHACPLLQRVIAHGDCGARVSHQS